MVDDVDDGRRPVRIGAGPGRGRGARRLPRRAPRPRPGRASPPTCSADLLPLWGPVVELWEGHAADADGAPPGLERRRGDGARHRPAAARRGAHGVLHVRAVPDEPWRNEPVLSRDRGRGARRLRARATRRPARARASPWSRRPRARASSSASPATSPACSRPPACGPSWPSASTSPSPCSAPARRARPAPSRCSPRWASSDLGDVRSLDYRGDGWPGDARAEHAPPGATTATAPLTYERVVGRDPAAAPARGAARSARTTPASSPTSRWATRGGGPPATTPAGRSCWPAPSGAGPPCGPRWRRARSSSSRRRRPAGPVAAEPRADAGRRVGPRAGDARARPARRRATGDVPTFGAWWRAPRRRGPRSARWSGTARRIRRDGLRQPRPWCRSAAAGRAAPVAPARRRRARPAPA